MVGKLIYLAQSRPNIAYWVSIVSAYMNQPQVPHMLVFKHIFRYLKGTKNLGPCYKQGDWDILTRHVDANWVGDSYDRKSNTKYLFRLGETPITWNSKKKTTVTPSSTEAKYMALIYRRNKGGQYGCIDCSKKSKYFKARLQQRVLGTIREVWS